MPGIKVFGRRWAVGSDDFVFPAAAEIFLRAVWLLTLSIVLGVHNDSLSCTNGHLLRLYFVGMLIILPLEMLASAFVMYFSMQGTITNDEPRKLIPSLIICKLFMFFIEIIWTIIGTYWAFSNHVEQCPVVVVNVVKGATIVGWILLLLLVVGIIVVFDAIGSTLSETPTELQRIWKLRCKLICCSWNFGSGGRNNRSAAFDEVTRIITEHLVGVDFVITDIAAALILVQRRQEREAFQRLSAGITTPRISYTDAAHGRAELDANFHPKDWMTITYADAFMKYALASYGWLYFVYDNQFSGPFKLCCECKCCFCLRPADNVHGDNCCGCNTAAVLEQAHIRREDIFYANYNNQLYETPFYIIFDHETKSIVLSVRGSLSFDDALTDMSADLEVVSVEGVPDAKTHKGILQAARHIVNMNNRYHLLEEAFDRTEGYDLVIVGHSLGAGVAAILAILLKPQYPNLKCFSYSPPGWLLSLSLNRYAKEFVCSVVVGKDVVPRLGLVTIERLKENMIMLVRQSNKPKYKILAGSAWRNIFCCWADDGVISDDDEDIEGGVSTEPLLSRSSSARKRNYTDEQEEPQEQSQAAAVVHEPLFMPGIVLFLEELEPGRGCLETPKYQAFWMKPESFDEILVSGLRMVHDHMPNVVYKALKSLVNYDSNRPVVQHQE